MTAKAWCAISKAVEMIKAAQNTSVGRAQAWLIEACSTGNVRSRADSILLRVDDGIVGMDLRPGALRTGRPIWRVAGPVSSVTWKNAVIDGDALVDSHHGQWDGVEISISDLEFALKRSLPAPDSTTALPAPISRSGGRPYDKERIMTEAERRLADRENIPSSLAAFARDLNHWLNKQPWAYRRPMDQKVLATPSIEDHIRPLWRKYRPD